LTKFAIILNGGEPSWRESRLGCIFDFFRVPWKVADALKPHELGDGGSEYAVFGSIRNVAAALKQNSGGNPPAAYYAYVDDKLALCNSALQSLFGDTSFSLQTAPPGELPLQVSEELPDLAGPMAGLKCSLRLRSEDAVLGSVRVAGVPEFATLVSAADSPVFLRYLHNGVPIYLCTSSDMVDIDQPVRQGFYDVKDHFCSAAPLVMFIKFMFQEIAWQAQELGACLIIDDPLLKPRYGFCDFPKLRSLMQRYGFTTNIAFIPWNWRRTSPAAAKFFNDESRLFSVSIHGCDHTAGEFASISTEGLNAKTQLARSRMRKHQLRTGIRHDPVMVFPQGAFSSVCPEVLKRNGFLAAVNTELVPMDSQNSRTRIRDVWDVAIMAYDNFPIFTRRYAFHGLENFAFDLLLGKPCLIVAHHDFFKDDGRALINLIEKIGSLNCRLRWRSLGQVIRRACRRRADGAGKVELEMYGSELLVGNPSDQPVDLTIRKRRSHDELASEILCDEKSVAWTTEGESFVFGETLGPHGEKCFRVVLPEQIDTGKQRRPLRFELAVAARRILSELRDDYVSTSRILSVPAEKLKNVFKNAL